MPGPPARAVEQREALNEALKAVHGALVPFIERLRSLADSVRCLRYLF